MLRSTVCSKAADAILKGAVYVEPAGKTLAWPNGADIDPDVLYLGLPPAA